MLYEVAAKRGVTPSALIGGWLLDSVNLPLVQSAPLTPDVVPAKKARRMTSKMARKTKNAFALWNRNFSAGQRRRGKQNQASR